MAIWMFGVAVLAFLSLFMLVFQVHRRGSAWARIAWLLLFMAGFFHVSCLAPYYYDPYHHRIWRDGHDDDWHRAHGDHWDEYRP